MADETDGGEESTDGSGSTRGKGSSYTPKSTGYEFVHLVNCMTKIANKTRETVQSSEMLKKQLDKTPKTTLFFFENFDYMKGKSSVRANIASIYSSAERIFKENYGNYEEKQAAFSMHGVLPQELTFQYLDHVLHSPSSPKWLDAGIVSDTKVGLVRGSLLDRDSSIEPYITVSIEKEYSSSPREFIARTLKLDGVSMKNPEISFNLGSKSGLKKVFDDDETFKNHFKSEWFSSDIVAEREKTFAPDGSETRSYGSRTLFEASLKTSPVGASTSPDTVLNLMYHINANRLEVNLPQEELKWLEDAVNSLIRPLPGDHAVQG